ncbi:MAG: barstar family protein [Lachnospiraceae bacterium]|nr:barstar family protein [Lachnospiraceae bacterium]
MAYIDSRRFTDRVSAHEYLAQELMFPEHYGMNLDALHDCLTEFGGRIVVGHTAEAGACYEEFRQVFMDSARENSHFTFEEVEGEVKLCPECGNALQRGKVDLLDPGLQSAFLVFKFDGSKKSYDLELKPKGEAYYCDECMMVFTQFKEK